MVCVLVVVVVVTILACVCVCAARHVQRGAGRAGAFEGCWHIGELARAPRGIFILGSGVLR